ncbi:MAG: signal recognition particle receptor subunit alpha, partial [Treponema sp.]|nr:signal recognition particle receptor subunit alpha [Treponema sp.]
MAKLSFAEKIRSLFSKNIDNSFFEEIEDALIEGDIGAKTAVEISALLKTACKKSGATSESEIKMQLYEILLPYLQEVSLSIEKNKTNIWMLLGVNGVGKTTSAAKLANMYSEDSNQNIVLAASDTFRAAAIEQLTMHANKLKVRIVSHQHGSDPSAVI